MVYRIYVVLNNTIKIHLMGYLPNHNKSCVYVYDIFSLVNFVELNSEIKDHGA